MKRLMTLGIEKNNRCIQPVLIPNRGLKFVSTDNIEYPLPPKYNYTREGYPIWRNYDTTYYRFNENTKLISVEGNICSGKSVVARKLVDAFGMKYHKDVTEDDMWTFKLPWGQFDLREHNRCLPDEVKYYTSDIFWNQQDPIKNGKPLHLLRQYFANRFFIYCKALATLFNTGQGSVVEKSHFSEFIFAQAMNKCGLLSDYALEWFMPKHGYAVNKTFRPHLICYVRTPVEMIREEIERRNIPMEKDAINLTDKFLRTYAELFEKNYLEPMSQISKVYIIDRSQADIYDDDEMQVHLERMSQFDLDGTKLHQNSLLFAEWRSMRDDEKSMKLKRYYFSNVEQCYLTKMRALNWPLDMYEGIVTPAQQELRGEIIQRDDRLGRYNLYYDARHAPLWQRVFNPYVYKKNYEVDWPKHFIFNQLFV